MSDEVTERTYYLIESGLFEKLLKTHFMLAHTLLLFEHLCSHSDRPMFLSARKVCEALGLDRNKLEQYRRKRIIKARAVNGQMMYSAYDLICLLYTSSHRCSGTESFALNCAMLPLTVIRPMTGTGACFFSLFLLR